MTHTLTTERMAEIAKLAIRLQQISSCAAVTSSGETVLHHTHVDEILSALHDVTAELLANREAQPVGFDVLADAVKEVTGGIRMEFNPDTYKGHQSVPFMNFTSLSRIVEMFRTAPPAPAYPETLPCAVRLMPGIIFGEGVRTSTMLDGLRRREEYNAEMAAMTPDQKAEHDAGHEALKAMLLSRSTPAPVVNPEFTGATAVPDEREIFEAAIDECRKSDSIDEHAWNHGVLVVMAKFEECRAAMRAQPVSQGYKLPPHAYRELVNTLRDTAVKYSGTDQLRERLNTALSQFIEPDHPHTRTAAPEISSD